MQHSAEIRSMQAGWRDLARSLALHRELPGSDPVERSPCEVRLAAGPGTAGIGVVNQQATVAAMTDAQDAALVTDPRGLPLVVSAR